MKSRSRKYLLTVAATYHDGDKKIEGKIKINYTSVVFASTSTSKRYFKIEVPIHDITDICKKNSLGIIPNIIILKTPHGDYKFAVYSREHVVRLIQELKNTNP